MEFWYSSLKKILSRKDGKVYPNKTKVALGGNGELEILNSL